MSKRKIEKKLEQLQKLLDQIDEARIINYDDPDTWDSDVLYNLVRNLKKALSLLENKVDKKKLDEFGEPLMIEEGLCLLMDDHLEGEEEDFRPWEN